MQSFTMRDLELLTGIKASTLRTWQHHDYLKLFRRQTRKYFYSSHELKRILSVAFLHHNGWKISEIATLSDEEMNAEADKLEVLEENYMSFIQLLLRAAIGFNEAAFVGVLNHLTDKIGFERTIVNVCYPYLQRVEMIWESDKNIPAQEHFSVYLIQNKIIGETEKFSALQDEEPELVLYCPEYTTNEWPLLFINYLLRKNGWRVLYLGVNDKFDDVKEAAQLPGVKFVYVHFLVPYSGVNVDDYLEVLRKKFANKIIIVSGLDIGKSQRNFIRIYKLKRDEEIYRFIERRGAGSE